MVQIIASDMDGTLLNDKMVISKRNAAAVKEAQKQGIHFIVSTGRAYDEVKPLITEAGFNCRSEPIKLDTLFRLYFLRQDVGILPVSCLLASTFIRSLL